MEPTAVSLFAQFGYPALISGFLLYIIINKLEKMLVRLEDLEKALLLQDAALKEYRQEVKEACEELQEQSRKS